MKYYKSLCLVIVVNLSTFALVSLFYRPEPGTALFLIMKYLFFVPLVLVAVLQLVGLLMNIMRGHVNTIGATRFVVYEYKTTPTLFFFAIAWEAVLWTLPAYAVVRFLAR